MKTILPLLLLTSLGLAAQIPPAPPAVPAVPPVSRSPGANTNSTRATPAPPAATNAQPAALKRLIPPTTRGPAAPPAPAVAPSSGAGAVPAPGAPGAAVPPTAPPAPAAQTTTVSPAAAAPAAPSAPAPAPPTTAPEDQTIPSGFINWVGADLNNQVLPIYADMVGRSILRPATLPAATLIFKNQTPLTKQEAIQAIDAVLALNGIAMINVGDKFVKALPLAQAGGAGGVIRTNDASGLPELGGYHTHVVQLKYIKPSEVLPVIQPFASVGLAPPIAIESSQMLVIRDNAENVKRMLEMIEKVDVTIPSEFISEVIPIKFAMVEDIAAALNSLSGGGGQTSIGSSGRGAGGAPGVTTGRQVGQPYNPNMPRTTSPMSPQTGLQTGTPSSGGSFSDRIRQIVNRVSSAAGGGDLQIIGVTKIVADARSNSLLIFATRQDMEMIKDIVNKLDVVLAQVLIETLIMDVTLSDNWQFGVSAVQEPHTFPSGNKGVGGYKTGNKFFDFIGGLATNAFPGGLTDALPDGGFHYFAKLGSEPTFDVALKAAADDSRVNVIQRPIIQTSHATPASIFVGNTVPYVSSTYYGGGYAGGPSSSYQQLQVGISLSVTPFINADGLVVMQINETIDEISSYTKIDNNAVPNTTSRTLTAEVAVRDRELIMLGGFIRNSDLRNKSGVPFLKDIPLLGMLFSSNESSKQRSELIVLMRPTVLRTPELAALQVNEEKKRLPGVLDAESRIGGDEKKKLEKSQKKNFNQTTPFTPEEQELYGKPAPVQP